MIICSRCGAKLQDGSRFCGSCGAQVTAQPAPAQPVQAGTQTAPMRRVRTYQQEQPGYGNYQQPQQQAYGNYQQPQQQQAYGNYQQQQPQQQQAYGNYQQQQPQQQYGNYRRQQPQQQYGNSQQQPQQQAYGNYQQPQQYGTNQPQPYGGGAKPAGNGKMAALLRSAGAPGSIKTLKRISIAVAVGILLFLIGAGSGIYLNRTMGDMGETSRKAIVATLTGDARGYYRAVYPKGDISSDDLEMIREVIREANEVGMKEKPVRWIICKIGARSTLLIILGLLLIIGGGAFWVIKDGMKAGIVQGTVIPAVIGCGAVGIIWFFFCLVLSTE